MQAVAVGWECPECRCDTAHWYGVYTKDGKTYNELSCVRCGVAWDTT